MTGVEGGEGGRWTLGLRVEPGDAEPFDARTGIELADGASPVVGGVVEVLHLDGRVLALGAPAPPPPPPEPAAPPGPPPDLAAVVRGLARALGDGTLAQGLPVIVSEAGGPSPPRPASGLETLSLERLAARAGEDPAAVMDEVTRRVGAGEATLAQVLAAARAAGLDGADLARIVRARRTPPT